MTKTILFGAGASIDESANGPVPLTKDLFDILRETKESWKNLPDDWDQEFRNTEFEKAMQKLLDKYLNEAIYRSGSTVQVPFDQISKDPSLRVWSDLQWDLAEYFYLEHRIKADSLYIKLLEEIRSNFTSFQLSTLNYDILLLQALELIGLVGPDVSLISPIPICSPHGSSLFYCCTPNFKRTENGYAIYPGTQLAGDPLNIDENINRIEIKAFSSGTEFKNRKEDLFPPIMCYIEPMKRIKVGKKFIQAEQQKWKDWVNSSEAIVVIGVNITLDDKHIWDPLCKTKAPILYVSGEGSRENFHKWREHCQRSNPKDEATDKKWIDSQSEISNFLSPV